jgi:hypothetical protein
MKKIKLFGLIAIALLIFSFSGCDAILEALYPEFGQRFNPDGGGGGNNITIFVEVIPGKNVMDPQIAVMVVDRITDKFITDAYVFPFWNWDEGGNLFFTANIELFNIPDGEYRVTAWLERTLDDGGNWIANGFSDFDEPQRDAEWFPMGPGTEPDNNFYFPNDAGNWIEGTAFLEVFEGEMRNRNFGLRGQRVINVAELSTDASRNKRVYELVPADSELTIVEAGFTLWGPTGVEDQNYVFFTAGETSEITISHDGATADYYWLDVEVLYNDDWFEYKGFPIRVLTRELPNGTPYEADVVISSTLDWPINISNGVHVNWKYSIIDRTGTVESFLDGIATVTNDAISFTTATLTYDSTVFQATGIAPTERSDDGVDILRIKLDVGQDGVWNFVTGIPLGVSNTDDDDVTAGFVPIDIWAGDFRHIF